MHYNELQGGSLEEVREELALKLEELNASKEICTTLDLDTQIDELVHVVLEVIDTKVPKNPFQ